MGRAGAIRRVKKRGLGGLRDWEAASSPALDSSVGAVATISDVLALVALEPVALARLSLSACCWRSETGMGSPRDWGAQ